MIRRPVKERHLPYKILAFLLYAPDEADLGITSYKGRSVRVETGPLSRYLRVRIAQVWDALRWLEEHHMVESVSKGRKRGLAQIVLIEPINLLDGTN